MARLKIIDPEAAGAPMDLFSYAALSREDEAEVREAAERIKLRLRRTAEDIIEIGKDLIEVKERLPHGMFLPWLKDEFDMTRRTATSFMQVAEQYGGKWETISHLKPTALYALASAEPEVQERIEAMIEAGEVVTKATVEELRARLAGVEQAKAGRDRAVAAAQDEIGERDEKIKVLQSELDQRVAAEVAAASKRIEKGFQDEIDRLKREVAELKKPKLAVTADRGDGNVVEFHRPLTEQEKAEIDAADDEYAGADFNKVASDKDRARAVAGSIQLIASAAAKPNAVYVELTERFSKKLIAENFATLDKALALLQQVKEMHK